jgi:glycosyltransferase involved in cell wall biosynthesis
MLNEERFILRCLESVIVQSYGNWILYISDNCSDDSSTALVKNTLAKSDKIRLIQRTLRVNPELNWNELAEIALSESNPDFVMWLGADDFLENPDYLENMMRSCSKDGIIPSFKNCREDGSYYQNHIFRTDCTSNSRIINQSRLAKKWANVVAIYGLYKVSVFEQLLRGTSSRLTDAPESDWWWSFSLHNQYRISSSENNFYVKTIKKNPYYTVSVEKGSPLAKLRIRVFSNLSFRMLSQAIQHKDRINKKNLGMFIFTYLSQVLFMIIGKAVRMFTPKTKNAP